METQTSPSDSEHDAETPATVTPSVETGVKGEGGKTTAQPRKNEQESPAKSRPKSSRADLWQVAIQGSVLLGALWALSIYKGQLVEMREANRLMKVSTDAATKAAVAAEDGIRKAEASAHLDQRAWLGATNVDGQLVKDQKYKVDVTLKNTGKTFARKVTLRAGILRVPNWQIPNFDEILDSVEAKSRGLIPPDGMMHFIKETSAVIDEKGLSDIETGAYNLFIFGKTTYEDIFFCEHWTTFCYIVHGSDKSGWNHDAYQSYNDADSNCGPTAP
jgi:hypothetical protein